VVVAGQGVVVPSREELLQRAATIEQRFGPLGLPAPKPGCAWCGPIACVPEPDPDDRERPVPSPDRPPTAPATGRGPPLQGRLDWRSCWTGCATTAGQRADDVDRVAAAVGRRSSLHALVRLGGAGLRRDAAGAGKALDTEA
jgi:hypothetical protein